VMVSEGENGMTSDKDFHVDDDALKKDYDLNNSDIIRRNLGKQHKNIKQNWWKVSMLILSLLVITRKVQVAVCPL